MQYFTTVGLGVYKETQYKFEDDEKHVYKTNFVQEAIIDRFKDELDEAIFFVTPESKEKYWAELEGKFGKLLKIKSIEVNRNISYEEFSAKLFENMNANEDAIIDITQSFRHIPMKLLFSLRYIELTKQLKIKHLYYGQILNQETLHDPENETYGLIIDFIREFELQKVSELLSQFDRTLLVNSNDIEEVLEDKDEVLDRFLHNLSDFNKVIERAELNRAMNAIFSISKDAKKIINEDEKYSIIIPFINKIQNKFEAIISSAEANKRKIELIKLLHSHNRLQITITFLDQCFRDELIFKTLGLNENTASLNSYCKSHGIKYWDGLNMDYIFSQYLIGNVYELRGVGKVNEQKTCERILATTDADYEQLKNKINPYKKNIRAFYGDIRNSMNHGKSIDPKIDVDKVIDKMIECLENM